MANLTADLADIEVRIARLEPRPVAAQLLSRQAAPEPQRLPPHAWIFTPHRDSDNLVVEIIAEPVESARPAWVFVPRRDENNLIIEVFAEPILND